MAAHIEILHRAIEAHRGVLPLEQGEGDSVVAAFARASDATRAAIAAQAGLAGSGGASDRTESAG